MHSIVHLTPRHGYKCRVWILISATGSDTNYGTSISSPWKTIQKAIDVALPGDVINVRGGTYSQTIEFTKSGSSAGYITLQSYPGETTKLDGTSITNASGGMIVINSRNYIKIIGLEICNFKTSK